MFLVNFDEVKKVLDAISRVSNPKAVAKIVLGVQEVGNDVACAVKVLGGSEEVAVRFLAKKPKDFNGTPSQGCFLNTSLIAIMQSLCLLKESICMEIMDTVGKFGVANKAMTSLSILGEDEIPSGVELNKDSQITRFFVKQSDFVSLLKGGGFATATADQAGKGVANATLEIKDKELILYSCNEAGSTLGIAKCPVDLNDIEVDGTTKRAKWCEEKGVESLIVPIPRKVVMNMLGFLDGEGKCSLIITDKVLLMAPTDSIQYMAVVGAKAFTAGVTLIERIGQMPTEGVAVVDNEKLKTSLTMIQNFTNLSNKKGAPVELKFGKDKLMLTQENGDSKVLVDLVASSFENTVSRYLDGEKLATIIGVLAKGNVKMEVREQENCPLVFTNGSLTENTGSVKALLAPVQKPATEKKPDEAKAETEAEATEADTTTATEE